MYTAENVGCINTIITRKQAILLELLYISGTGEMMFNSGDAVIYGTHGVCIVKETSEFTFGDSEKTYYVLQPLNDKLQIFVPCDSEILLSRMRPVLTPEEVDGVIDSLSEVKMGWIDSDSKRKEFCNEVIKSGDREQLIHLIDMLYVRQDDLRRQKKHFHLTDERFMKEAMKLLHEEFSYVLGIPEDVVPQYISSRIESKRTDCDGSITVV